MEISNKYDNLQINILTQLLLSYLCNIFHLLMADGRYKSIVTEVTAAELVDLYHLYAQYSHIHTNGRNEHPNRKPITEKKGLA